MMSLLPLAKSLTSISSSSRSTFDDLDMRLLDDVDLVLAARHEPSFLFFFIHLGTPPSDHCSASSALHGQ